MFKRFFQSHSVERGKLWPASAQTETPESAGTEPQHHQSHPHIVSTGASERAFQVPDARVCATFDQIYRNGSQRLAVTEYSILKLSEMMGSPHLAGMSAEAKRNALMMALEAAGADVEMVLKDAMLRQRALSDYEEEQRGRVKEFEIAKANENRGLQAELDRITADYTRRMQENTDEVARCQDEFEAWQKRKLVESQRIEEASAICARPGGAGTNTGPLTVRERSAVSGR